MTYSAKYAKTTGMSLTGAIAYSTGIGALGGATNNTGHVFGPSDQHLSLRTPNAGASATAKRILLNGGKGDAGSGGYGGWLEIDGGTTTQGGNTYIAAGENPDGDSGPQIILIGATNSVDGSIEIYNNSSLQLSIASTGNTTITPTAGNTALTLTGGTTTTSAPPLSVTQAWNSGGTTFRGLEMAITETADAAASTYFRIQGGASATTHEFSILKGGITCTTGNFQGTSGTKVGWTSSSTDPTGTPDVVIRRVGAGKLALGLTSGGVNDADGLEIVNNSGNSVWASAYGDSSVYPRFFMFHAQGTAASPSNTANGDTLGAIFWGGRRASTTSAQAFIQSFATEDWSSAGGCYMSFGNTITGNGGASERLRLDASGFTRIPSDSLYGFSSASNNTGSVDTNISRNAAGVIQFGTSSAGVAGSWVATKGWFGGTTAGTHASIAAGAAANSIQMGTTGNSNATAPGLIYTANTDLDCRLEAFGTTKTPYLFFVSATGTAASPGATGTGTPLGILYFMGRRSGIWSGQARIAGITSDDFGSGNGGTYLQFTTTITGATVEAERMRLDGSGFLRYYSGGVIGFSSASDNTGSIDTGFSRDSAGVAALGNGSQGNASGTLKVAALNVAAGIDTTAGDAATINKTAGRFRKDTSGTTFTLTNSFITANSIIVLTAANAAIDATATDWTVSAGSGSATITFNAAPSANFDMNFIVIN